MNKTIEYCQINKMAASFYSNENDPDAHLTGYIEAYNETELLIAHISYYGMYDGYILKRIDDIYRIDFGGKYEEKIKKLYKLKNQRHRDLNISDEYILEPLLEFAKKNELVVSFELDGYVISGFVEELREGCVRVRKVDEYGEPGGESVLEIDAVLTIAVDTDDEQNIKLLYENRGE